MIHGRTCKTENCEGDPGWTYNYWYCPTCRAESFDQLPEPTREYIKAELETLEEYLLSAINDLR